MANPIGKADANASRAFFVQMLTRDITLEDCILDLLDNSVDGAWTSLGHQAPTLDEDIDLSPFRIELTTRTDKFVMRDNCGGMPKERAEKHAFTFGRKFEDPDLGGDFRIGVYGIGMKRAIFKLGSKIDITSTYQDDNATKSFHVPIDVNAWMRNTDNDWSFAIYESKPSNERGVTVEVKDLIPGTKNAFGNPAFLQNLRRVISRDYALHLHRGLSIILNGEEVEPWEITLLRGTHFEPLRKSWTIETPEGSVNVEILAGAAALPLDEDSPDENDTGEARFGWYVACNGRIVLAADKTNVSVWGFDNFPIWHRQYRGFIGIILFTSEETALLPLTTTKRSVDLSSEIYLSARPEMRDATRAWITYTNARKQDRERARAAEASSKAISIFRVPVRDTISTPVIPAKPKVKITSIQYSMPASKIREIASKLGNINMPAAQVGVATFEYTYEDMIGNG